MEVVPTSVLIAIGAIALAVVVWILKSFCQTLDSQIKNLLKDQQEQIKKDAQKGREEREYDNYLLLRGMQVISDVEHELVYCVMNGTHNGGLDKASKELEEFRRLSNENLVQKASRWKFKIEK